MALDLGVFHNSSTGKYHLAQFENLDHKEFSLYEDVEFFMKFNHAKNLAVLHWPYPYDPEFGDIVDKVYDKCDKIIIIITEVHNRSVEFMQKFDRSKISYYIAGTLETPLENARVSPYMDWFNTSRYFYRDYLPEILTRLDHTVAKPNSFDILLGRKKPHRDYVYNWTRHNLRGKDYCMRYFNSTEPVIFEDDTHWIYEHRGVVDFTPKKWTVDFVNYYGHNMSLSQVLPICVYGHTTFSVVAETNYENYYTFFTEKTAKPIIARRMFVMFAGRGYLKALRSFGFKTFDGIIDESYDDIEDPFERYEAVCKLMSWICDQDQQELLNKTLPIVEHNFRVMMDREWYTEFNQSLESEVQSLIGRI